MKKIKRLIAALLCLVMLCSVLSVDMLTSFADESESNASIPSETITYEISKMSSLDELTAGGNISVFSRNNGALKTIEDGVLKLGKQSTGATHISVLLPNSYVDQANSLTYPVSGLEGRIQLNQYTQRNGTMFLFNKDAGTSNTDGEGTTVTTQKYGGNTVNMRYESGGLQIRLHRVLGTYTKTVTADDVVTEAFTASHQGQVSTYTVTNMKNWLTDTSKQEEFETAINGITDGNAIERWVDYKIYHKDGSTVSPYLLLTITVGGSEYELDVPLIHYQPNTNCTIKAFVVGNYYGSSSYKPATNNTQCQVGDFTVSYDLSSYYADVSEAFDDRIEALGYFTSDDYNALTEIYQDYQALTDKQKPFVNIERVEKAIQAFSDGAYFYDDFEGDLNWQIISKVTDETSNLYDNLKETNVYSTETAAYNGNDAGEAFWGIHTDVENTQNKALWLRKSFNASNTRAQIWGNRLLPTVAASLKEDILPDDAKISFVKGRMYIGGSTNANEAASATVGLSYLFDGEYNWKAVGSNYNGGLRLIQRTGATTGNNSQGNTSEEFLFNGTLSQLASKQWVEFSLEYKADYGCYVFYLNGVDTEGQPVSWEVQLPNGTKPMSQIALAHTNVAKQSFDDISIGLIDSKYVEQCIGTYLPNPDDLSLETLEEHTASILMVYNIVSMLSGSELEQVSNIDEYNTVYSKYQALVAERDGKLTIDQTITFELQEAGQEYFDAVNAAGTSGWGVTDNPNKSGDNKSNKVLEITKNYSSNQDAGNNRAVYKLKDKILDGTQLLSNFSGKVYLDSASTATVIYEYSNENRWTGFQLAVSNNGVTYRKVTKNGAGNLTLDKSATKLLFLDEPSPTLPETGLWVSFDLEYTMTTVLLTVKYEHEGQNYMARTRNSIILTDSCMTRIGLATGATAIFDDLRVNVQGTEGYLTKKSFLSFYTDLLQMIPVKTYVSVADSEMLTAMQVEYDAYTDEIKTYMPFVDVRMQYIQSALDSIVSTSEGAIRDQQMLEKAKQTQAGYTDFVFEDDFENGLSAWQPPRETVLNTGTPTTVYHEKFGSNVVKLDMNSLITPKKTLLPSKPQMVSVSYKIYRDPQTPDHAVYSTGVYLGGNSQDYKTGYGLMSNNYRYFYGNKQMKYEKHSLDMNTVLEVNITYTSGGNALLIIEDGHGTTKQFATRGTSVSSLMLLGAYYNNANAAVYMDDLKVVYREGAYDINVINDDITVYYTGNTVQSADDYVTLSGENLANNVIAALVSPLTNSEADLDKATFISQERFDSIGAQAGQYSKDPVAHQFDEESAIKADIVQKTTNSIKFRIPVEFERAESKGAAVYAIKLVGLQGKEKIVYMNNPHIDYTVGSDGEITSPGKEIRVIGKNLAPTKNQEDLKALFVAEDGTVTEGEVTAVQSVYSVSVKVPIELASGQYELWLHSGIGDDTAWTVPVTVQIDAPVRDSWPSKVFNVQDYGATGASSQNATPYLVNALSAIAENGGGILYLPIGTYTIRSELHIPEKCRIIGESDNNTTINIDSHSWAMSHLRDVFKIKQNVEFTNIRIVGTRVGSPFVMECNTTESENVYFNNVYFYCENMAGRPTGGANGTYEELVTSSEMAQLILKEGTGGPILSFNGHMIQNLQIDNFRTESWSGTRVPIVVLKGGSEYWKINKFDMEHGGWIQAYTSNSIWENSTMIHATMAFWGNGNYLANCTLSSNSTNNRELWVADNGPFGASYLTPVEGDTTGTKFYTNNTFKPGEDKMSQYYIKSGQGVGQTRIVTDVKNVQMEDGSSKRLITINEPFVIQPNRSSGYTLRSTRENMYFVDNTFYSGSAVGFYGGAADVVFDGCTYDSVAKVYAQGRLGDVDFYISYINLKMKQGTTGQQSGKNNLGIHWEALATQNAIMCFLMRDCEIDGQYNKLDSTPENGIVDVIYQRNEWRNTDYAIALENRMLAGDTRYSGYDGILIADNSLVNVGSMFQSGAQRVADASMATTNDAGYKRMMILDEVPTYDVLGDVNGDGVVSLKDATLILYAVVGKTELSEEQIRIGDVDGDGFTNLRDASLIKLKVVGKITLFPLEEKEEEGESQT